MGEVVQFVSKSERERARLIREARAIYESIFPSADPLSTHQDSPTIGQGGSGANVHRSDRSNLS
jgi:hypothetical protein